LPNNELKPRRDVLVKAVRHSSTGGNKFLQDLKPAPKAPKKPNFGPLHPSRKPAAKRAFVFSGAYKLLETCRFSAKTGG